MGHIVGPEAGLSVHQNTYANPLAAAAAAAAADIHLCPADAQPQKWPASLASSEVAGSVDSRTAAGKVKTIPNFGGQSGGTNF